MEHNPSPCQENCARAIQTVHSTEAPNELTLKCTVVIEKVTISQTPPSTTIHTHMQIICLNSSGPQCHIMMQNYCQLTSAQFYF